MMYAQNVDHNFRNIGTVFNQSEARSVGLKMKREKKNDESAFNDFKPARQA